ncbi:MAG: LysR family transcriptional regulator [Eubacteriales bacterium]|nr:LysR family transcriptional regulator [Eubacteriales bacterium]
MKLEYMREFLSVVESNNFMESAEEQYISQAALSRHIQQLESSLGVELFDRSLRRVTMTQEGEKVVPYARELVELYENMKEDLKQYQMSNQNGIKIGYNDTLRLTGIMEELSDFKEMCGHIHLEISAVDREKIVRRIAKGELDCGCISQNEYVPDPQLGYICILTDMVTAVVPHKHFLAEQQRVSLEQLCQEKLILYNANVAVNQMLMDACARAGLHPDITLTTSVGKDVISLAGAGWGVGVMLRKNCRPEQFPDIVRLEISPQMKVAYYFVYNKKRMKNEAVCHLVTHIKEKFEIIENGGDIAENKRVEQ